MEPTPLRFTTSDVVIAADRRGDPRDPPVFFLHGGGQTRHSWGAAAEVVAERGWCTYTLDSRGHGESDWSTCRSGRRSIVSIMRAAPAGVTA